MNINDVAPIILNGVPLPYVSEIKHVGNILQSNNSMKKDISVKRAQFISKVHSLNQEFHFSNPSFVMKLYNIYACSFHGSSLWDLYSDNVNKLFTSWNISIRILFDIPRNTHRYLIEPISDCFHVKTLLCSRLISFYESLCKSVKPCIRLMTNLCKNNVTTSLGKNLDNISNDCNVTVDNLTKRIVKNSLKYAEIPKMNNGEFLL